MAGNHEIKTVSGSVIHIEDAAEANARDVSVGITYQQEGSGDPSFNNVRPITGYKASVLIVNRDSVGISEGNIYMFSWGTKADTVYEGTINYTTGVLTVNKVGKTYTGKDEEGWSKNYSTKAFYTSLLDAKQNQNTTADLICNTCKTDIWRQAVASFDTININNNSLRVQLAGDPIYYIDDWKALLKATPLQVVYTLKTPITYNLTPIKVGLLSGENYVYANSGNTSLTYISGEGEIGDDYLINLTGRQVDTILNKIHNNELVEKSSIDSTLSEPGAPAESSIISERILDFLNNTLDIWEYDATSTYEAKDLCLHNNGLYICVTDIEEPEAWTPVHWALTSLGNELGDIGKTLNLINHIIEKDSITPQELQQIATSRHAQDFLNVGDVIFIPWTDNSGIIPIKYEYPFVVADFITAEDEAGNLYENAIILQALYGVPYFMPFDAPEIIACPEGTTIESAYYYYTKISGTYTLIDPQPEAGSKVPTGSTYYRHFLNLATNSAIKYGLGDYTLSAYRQWLNSEVMAGFGWWHPMHSCDVSPEDKIVNLPGFMNGFTEEWKAIFKPVKVRTRRSDAFNREIINVYDTFFLPSLPQLYGSQTNAASEGQPWQYWKDVTGLEEPSNGSDTDLNEGRMIPVIYDSSGEAHTMMTRSSNMSNPANIYRLRVGYLAYILAYSLSSSLPATIIY